MANDIAEVEAFAEGMASAIKDKGTGDLVDLPDAPNLPKGSPLERALAAITDAYSPLFEQIKEGRKDGKYEIRSVGKGTRRGIKADARAMERELQLIRDREGPREGADAAGGLSDDLDRRLDRTAQNDIRGQLGLSRAIQQAGRSQLITSSTRQLAALQADLAQQRLQAELSVAGGGAAGGTRSSGSGSSGSSFGTEEEQAVTREIVEFEMRQSADAVDAWADVLIAGGGFYAPPNVNGLSPESAAVAMESAGSDATNRAKAHIREVLFLQYGSGSAEGERGIKGLKELQTEITIRRSRVALFMDDPDLIRYYLAAWGYEQEDIDLMSPNELAELNAKLTETVTSAVIVGEAGIASLESNAQRQRDFDAEVAAADADGKKMLEDQKNADDRNYNAALGVIEAHVAAAADADTLVDGVSRIPEYIDEVKNPNYPTLLGMAEEMDYDLNGDGNQEGLRWLREVSDSQDAAVAAAAAHLKTEKEMVLDYANSFSTFSPGGTSKPQDTWPLPASALAPAEMAFAKSNDLFGKADSQKVRAAMEEERLSYGRYSVGASEDAPILSGMGVLRWRAPLVQPGGPVPTVMPDLSGVMSTLKQQQAQRLSPYRALPSPTAPPPSIPGLGRPAALQQLMDDLQGTTRKPVPRVSGAVPTSMTRPSGDDGGVSE